MPPKPSIKSGEVFNTKQGYSVTVLDYKHAKEILVRFNDTNGAEILVEGVQLKRGNLLNPFHPTAYGVGFIGVGIYGSKLGGKVFTPHYRLWIGIMERCYSGHARWRNYTECSVDERWHNFQEFAEWCTHQKGFDVGYAIDKDILIQGNKVYSPETCVFVPQEVNNVFRVNIRDKGLPPGIFKGRRGFDVVSTYVQGGGNRISGFSSVEDAVVKYNEIKADRIDFLVETFRNELDPKAITAMIITSDKLRAL